VPVITFNMVIMMTFGDVQSLWTGYFFCKYLFLK